MGFAFALPDLQATTIFCQLDPVATFLTSDTCKIFSSQSALRISSRLVQGIPYTWQWCFTRRSLLTCLFIFSVETLNKRNTFSYLLFRTYFNNFQNPSRFLNRFKLKSVHTSKFRCSAKCHFPSLVELN